MTKTQLASAETESVHSEVTRPPSSVPMDVTCLLKIIKQPIPFSMLDPDAVKIIRRLNRFGFDAYLVGGCVRDILLGGRPKDFDVVTSAMPAEIKRMFRNCRLIGRRFRLAHLHFKNRKVIEVATFRRSPTDEDDISHRHAAENLFGGPADDAVRRDFTINALMYNVASKEIIDWVGGLEDIQRGLLRTIGDPARRMVEDPVRVLRAVKFGVKLDLSVDEELEGAMRTHCGLLNDCAPARLVDEIFKILRSGHAAPCMEMIHEIGALGHLLPNLSTFVDEMGVRPVWTTLERADDMIASGRGVSDSTLLAALLYEATKETLERGGDVAKALDPILLKTVEPMAFTRRHLSRVRQIFLAQRRLELGPGSKRTRKLLDREYAAEAIDLMQMRGGRKHLDRWREALATRHTDNPDSTPSPRARRRRRPRSSDHES